MNLLQKYLKLKGITAAKMHDDTGLGYHCVAKTVAGLRKGREPRRIIANYLGLSYEQAWGAMASRHLLKLINQEIQHNADIARERKVRVLKTRYLDHDYLPTRRVANI